MFDRLPASLHRRLLRLAHVARLRMWGLLRMEVRGTNVLVFDGAGRLLLVRHSYHLREKWMFPGGGLARGEDPAQTGRREVLEETGCRLDDAAWFATHVRMMDAGWRNRVELITGTTADTPRADGRELEELGFFALEALPERTSSTVLHAIGLWREWAASKG